MVKNLKFLISKVLNVDIGTINDDTSPENVQSWDSYQAILLLTELEKFYQIKLKIEDVISIKNVGDIKKCLIKYGIRAEA